MNQEREEIIKQLWGSLKHLSHTMHQYYRNIVPTQKPGHLFVFMRLRKDAQNGNNGIRVTDIAASLGISKPAVTQILGELEKESLIRRAMDPDDRRAVRVFMTPEGIALMDPAFDKLHQIFDGLIDHLGEENSQTLMTLLGEAESYITKEIGPTNSCAGTNCD